ncbi:MAG TPA: DNA-3-methyladenine glycosylase [Myxococcaceae bacterium]|nr:DNA-3-methyladenine glycosylase [Myxococcaceae bacterium]
MISPLPIDPAIGWGTDVKRRHPLEATPSERLQIIAGESIAPVDPARAIRALKRADPRLARVIETTVRYEVRPTTWTPFQALFRAIVYQQLSGKAASTILGRVIALFPGREFPSPEDIVAAAEEQLRSAGLSRNKVLAVKDLAARALDGTVPERDQMNQMSDEEIIERCTAVRGIGRWTVEMMLIFHLARPDVLPVDDLGVRKGAMRLYRLRKLPSPERLAKIAEPWRPWRSVGSWYMWRVMEMTGDQLPG